MAKNVYIHIPFCKSKCKYCSFVSFSDVQFKNDFLEALKKEIKYYYKGEKLNTLYFGGGTPSLLSVEDFKELLGLFNIDKNTEITAELNPENLTFEYLEDLHNTGINRLSIGAQTFNDEILKTIGRRHNSADTEKTVQQAKKVGFNNISLDFIYGLPNQTIKDFENDLLKAISMEIQHISLYGLKIDEGCYFFENMPDNLPDADIQADMYLKAIEILSEFEHYEISNFSLSGYYSKHNLNYWDNNYYYGFGVAAHGYINNVRYSNTDDLHNYIKNPLVHIQETSLSIEEQLEEEIFLGFRKMNGINIENINKKFNIDFDEKYSDIINKYSDKYILKTPTGYKLSIEGILISNEILSEFIN